MIYYKKDYTNTLNLALRADKYIMQFSQLNLHFFFHFNVNEIKVIIYEYLTFFIIIRLPITLQNVYFLSSYYFLINFSSHLV